jgi:hypothetical protein
VFGDRGNGYNYGWNADNSANARDRNAPNSPDQRYDTFIHMQKPSNPNSSWQIAAPNGSYTVRVLAGDPSFFDSVYKIAVEDVIVIDATPSATVKWFEGTKTVTVNDGKLTVSNAAGSSNNKIAFIEISPAVTLRDAAADAPAAQPLNVTRLQVKMLFGKANADGARVQGDVPSLAVDFKPAGVDVWVDVGGAIQDFTLNAKGLGKSAHGTFALKYDKRKGWRFAATLKGGAWAGAWADGGLSNATVKKQSAMLPVTLTIGAEIFGGGKAVQYTAKTNKTGQAK